MNFNELNPNNLIGERYQIISRIGRGAFGQTYLATDTLKPSNPQCVIKQLKPLNTSESVLQDAQKRFEDEAKILERLGHHNQIPQLLAYFKENQEFFIIQELIAGEDFNKELKKCQLLPEAAVICLLQNILEILVFVHQQEVIHRDIKPSNLIRRRSDNKFVLIDFGTVKEITSLSVNSSGQTISTKAIGTLGYIAPEQLNGRPQYNSDIYALGMTAIEALTGRSPIELREEHPIGEVVWRHQAQVSEKLAEILNKMIRYNYKERYQSATEVLNDLQPLTKIGQTLVEQYKIIRYLGGGIFGHTYLAENQRRPYDPHCIIKQLKPKSAAPSTLREAQRCFDTEVRVLERLGHHDQIPRLLDHFQDHQEFYLVRKFIEGEDLFQEITADQRLSEAQVKMLLLDVLKVLEFIHNENVIHRDIKPSNLIRRKKDGKIVLIDFGGVKEISALSINSQGQRISTQSLGTEGYMPPEQTAGQPDIRSDFYALGITAIQALTGKSPHTFPKNLQTGELVWRQGTQVSPKLAKVLDKMVRFDFRDRYQSASEILKALGQSPPIKFEPLRSRKRWQILLFLLITGIPIIILVSSILPDDEDIELFNQANNLKDSGRYEAAIVLYKKVLEIKPSDYQAVTNLVYALTRSNRANKYEDALNYCEKAIKFNHNADKAWNCKGIVLQAMKQYKQAIDAYTEALQINPDFADAWNNRGDCLLETLLNKEPLSAQDEAEIQKAIDDFDRAISKNKQFYLALFNKGRALYKLGDFSQAVIAYTKASEIKPDHGSSWIGKADSLRALRENEKALNAYLEATNIEPKSFEAWYKKGKMEEEMGRYQDASSSYKQAQKINPTNQDVIQAIRRLRDNFTGK